MNYDAAVRYLLALGRELAAPTQAAAAKFDLENIQILNERLGRPDHGYPSIHIAGTNGKGSTAAFLESILQHAGFRTGLNTSPHLEKINERMQINGEAISDEAFAETLTRVQAMIEDLLATGKLRAHPTFFECVTAMAFEYFGRERVDFGIFEVGLGGRLDATNILGPVVSIITSIDFDHENFLGHSIEQIAMEKAGIIKPGVPVVSAVRNPRASEVIRRRCDDLGARLVEVDKLFKIDASVCHAVDGYYSFVAADALAKESIDVRLSLAGKFQVQNALTAIAAARLLAEQGYAINKSAIQNGLAETRWPGRLEQLQSHPDVYLDGAHNPSAAKELAGFIEENLPDRKIWLIYGALRDKAVDEIAGMLFPHAAEVVFTEPSTSRSISATQLAKMAAHHAKRFSIVPSAEQALDQVLSDAATDDVIFVTGSLYLVGQLRHHWKSRSQVAAR
ncbi:MAG TPA: folylpolyglutamate synthase/dihydrofolate synthase family protein [Candidatus Dormibacteraeota bacterium]|nr:folylpolyglutamate synthase/dihydrofolate synthase family protein [Candidatus Dormibacteraeota bacterium]